MSHLIITPFEFSLFLLERAGRGFGKTNRFFYTLTPGPSPSARGEQLIRRVRQESNIARALDCLCQHPLMCGAGARDSARKNLPALGNVRLQELHILKVDQIDFIDAEAARLAPLHAAASPSHGTAGSLVLALETKIAIFVICRHKYP